MIKWFLLCFLILVVSPSEKIPSTETPKSQEQVEVETQTSNSDLTVEEGQTEGSNELLVEEGHTEGESEEGLTEGETELPVEETEGELPEEETPEEDVTVQSTEKEEDEDTEEEEVPRKSPVLDFWDVLESFQTCTLQGNNSTSGEQSSTEGKERPSTRKVFGLKAVMLKYLVHPIHRTLALVFQETEKDGHFVVRKSADTPDKVYRCKQSSSNNGGAGEEGGDTGIIQNDLKSGPEVEVTVTEADKANVELLPSLDYPLIFSVTFLSCSLVYHTSGYVSSVVKNTPFFNFFMNML
eukprot:sb/3467489/